MKQFSESYSVGACAVLVETAYTGMPPEGLLGRKSTEAHTQKRFWRELIAFFPLIRRGPHRKRKNYAGYTERKVIS
jgi:hypothetical protein